MAIYATKDGTQKNRSRTLRLMHDGISFDKILPKQVGQEWTENNLRK
jgi:hypothetical protein